jgi:mono/diheme cytochrome c family protein
MRRAAVALGATVGIAAVAILAGPAAIGAPDHADLLARGAEIAREVGCSTCHSPDGKATTGRLAYSGGRVEDWYAPALNAAPDAPLPWTATELYAFLRTGSSPLHGIAAGSMSEVVHRDLAALPDEDIAAVAAYFADLSGAPEAVGEEAVAAAMTPDFVHEPNERRGEWLYVGYCVSCHFNRPEAQTALRPELALNTAVSAPDPTNLIRVMLMGVTEFEGEPEAYMPGFAMLLSNRDVADIAAYLRAAYAADEDAWDGLERRAGEIRGLRDPMR